MLPPPIDFVTDSRVEHRISLLNGHHYHYLYGVPAKRSFRATIFLVNFSFILSDSSNQPVDKRGWLLRYGARRGC